MSDILRGLNVYLIGMMGTGKTTVGKLLAKKLAYRFLDTDEIIEQVSQKSINDIFVQEGEAGFRQLETSVLVQVSAYIRTVVSTGGGIILRHENWSYLQDGMVIWLDAPIEILVKRLAKDKTRPLLQTADLSAKLTSLLKARQSLYQQADLRITIAPEDQAKDVVEKIITEIPSKIKPEFSVEQN